MNIKRSSNFHNLADLLSNISSPKKSSPKKSLSPKSKRPPLHPKNVTGKKMEGIAHRGGKKNKTQRRK